MGKPLLVKVPGLPEIYVDLGDIKEEDMNLLKNVNIKGLKFARKRKQFRIKLDGLTSDEIAQLQKHISDRTVWNNCFSASKCNIYIRSLEPSTMLTNGNQQIAVSTIIIYESVEEFI